MWLWIEPDRAIHSTLDQGSCSLLRVDEGASPSNAATDIPGMLYVRTAGNYENECEFEHSALRQLEGQPIISAVVTNELRFVDE